MRAALRVLALLALALPFAAASQPFPSVVMRGSLAGLLVDGAEACAGAVVGDLAYVQHEDASELTLTLASAPCGVDAVTVFDACAEADETGVLWGSHVHCSVRADASRRIWLQPDGYAEVEWGAAWASGAWAPDHSGQAQALVERLTP